MNINRFNYEEYFLLYVDNELSTEERREVDSFVRENSDLREELEMLMQSVIRPDKKLIFDNKASLIKTASPVNPVNEINCEEYFILYGDNELTNEEKDWVEQFVYRHPQFQASFELFQAARLETPSEIVFPHKESLYRQEKDDRVIVMRWWKIAVAAAIVLAFTGSAYYLFSDKQEQPGNGGFAHTKPGSETNGIKPGKDSQTKESATGNPSTPEEVQVAQAPAINPEPANLPQRIIAHRQEQPGQTLLAVNTQPVQEEDPASTDAVTAKKIIPPSNLSTGTTVKPIELAHIETPADNPVSATEGRRVVAIDVEKSFEELAPNDRRAENNYAQFASNDDRIEVLNTTVSNKGKARGFFRKLGRVVDKATNFGSGNDQPASDKKGVRIASFQIALK